MRWTVLLWGVPVLLLAGCLAPSTEAPGYIDFTATWAPWAEEPNHLFLELTNTGGQTASVGPGATPVRVEGPLGVVPVNWSGASAARAVAPGESLELVLHPRAGPAGVFELVLDHAVGVPMVPPVGEYRACVGDFCKAVTGS